MSLLVPVQVCAWSSAHGSQARVGRARRSGALHGARLARVPEGVRRARAHYGRALGSVLTCEHPGLRSVFGDACPACAEERRALEPEPPITIEHARALLLSLDAEGERRSFREFVIGNWRAIEPNGRPFIANRGTDALIEHLQALGDGFINRLGIACAPGIGKTSVASVAFPAWMWARNPAWRVICASYAAELAINIAGKFHRVVTSDRYREVHAQTRVVGEALKALNTSRGGYRYAVGVEGALTGFRADAGIIDDSLNAIDANSRQAMRTVNDWFDQAFMTRFDHGDDAPICVIQQRLGEHDLIAHARARGFEILELPARHEVGRVCRTSIWVDTRTIDGEILCPEIQSEKFLDEQLRVLGPRGFACQYAQRPAPREGNQFKIGMWGYHVMPGKIAGAHPRHEKARQGAPRELKYRSAMEGRMKSLDVDWGCLSIDATGGSTSETASALAIVGVVGAGEWRHVLRDYTDGPKGWKDTIAACRRSLVDFAGMTGRQRDLEVLVEKKALGQGALFEELVEAIGAGDLLYPDGTPIKAKVTYYDPTGRGDKATRATALEPDLDAGLITVEDGAGWVAPFLDEFGMFGGGASRDDRVDAVAQCIDHRRAKGKSTLTIKFPTVRSWGVR